MGDKASQLPIGYAATQTMAQFEKLAPQLWRLRPDRDWVVVAEISPKNGFVNRRQQPHQLFCRSNGPDALGAQLQNAIRQAARRN